MISVDFWLFSIAMLVKINFCNWLNFFGFTFSVLAFFGFSVFRWRNSDTRLRSFLFEFFSNLSSAKLFFDIFHQNFIKANIPILASPRTINAFLRVSDVFSLYCMFMRILSFEWYYRPPQFDFYYLISYKWRNDNFVRVSWMRCGNCSNHAFNQSFMNSSENDCSQVVA